jgi:hypothetical protein
MGHARIRGRLAGPIPVYAPLPHAGARGRWNDDAIRGDACEPDTQAQTDSAAATDGGLKQGPGGLSSNFTGLHFAGLLVVPEQRANCEVRFSREVLPDYLWR